jgi:hypothetical protein
MLEIVFLTGIKSLYDIKKTAKKQVFELMF